MMYAKQAALIFAVALGTGFAQANQTEGKVDQDNTARNKEMKTTADEQSNKPNDLELTRKIRADLMANKELSTYAHNIKIITRDGNVLLRGPVRSENEKAVIDRIARTAAGATSVTNEITIAK